MIADDDIEGEEELEDETYEVFPERLMDGEAVIFDPVEFADEFDALAAQCRDGQLWVLQRKTKKWVSVEDIAKRPTPLTAVPKTRQ